MKIRFIINPISGAIKKQNLPQIIAQLLANTNVSYEIAFTERSGHATYLAEEAITLGFDTVVAVGGDGSINEVAKALLHSNVRLGIIPLGSGNGLAYHLGLPVRNVTKALDVILHGKTIEIDTLESNKGSVVSFCGIGVEALAARIYRHLGIRGFFAYVWATILTVFVKFKEKEVCYWIGNKKYVEYVYLFTVYNARYLGYKVGKVAQVSLQDGKMHVVRIKGFSKWKLPWIAFLELIGKMHWAAETTIYETDSLRIELTKKSPIQMDGDSTLTSSDFEIKVNPLSLKVIVPKYLENY